MMNNTLSFSVSLQFTVKEIKLRTQNSHNLCDSNISNSTDISKLCRLIRQNSVPVLLREETDRFAVFHSLKLGQ